MYVRFVRDLNGRDMKWEESLYERAIHAMDPAPSWFFFKDDFNLTPERGY